MEITSYKFHRRRSGWNSGGKHSERRRWVGAEWGEVYGEGCRELPSKVQGRAENELWHIMKATERSLFYLYDKIWGDNLH